MTQTRHKRRFFDERGVEIDSTIWLVTVNTCRLCGKELDL